MFTYSDGTGVKVGDSVLVEHGKTLSTVELLVCTHEDMAAIGVTDPGIMLLSPPFGRLYLPVRSLAEDPLVFVARANNA